MPQLEQLLEKYPQELRVVFKNFPIASHKYAAKAAMAALAAGRQNKFWEFHDELFKNYNQINDQKIQEIARQLGLNEVQFNVDKRNQSLANRIQQDYDEGINMGVRGTPTVFINGRKVTNRSMENMEAMINEEITASKGKGDKAKAQ